MNKKPQRLTIIGLGLAVLALVVGLVFATSSTSTAQAAQPAQTSTTPTATAGAKKGSALKDLRASFVQNLASQLGTDTGKLSAAYTAAVNQTVDQAVKDGKLTQAQADKIKQAAQNSGLGKALTADKAGKVEKVKELLQPAFDAAAKTLGLTSDQLKAELKQGKSIADVAQAKGVPVQTVKDAMLKAVKDKLDSAVANKTITQTQADKVYDAFSKRVDTIINRKGGSHKTK